MTKLTWHSTWALAKDTRPLGQRQHLSSGKNLVCVQQHWSQVHRTTEGTWEGTGLVVLVPWLRNLEWKKPKSFIMVLWESPSNWTSRGQYKLYQAGWQTTLFSIVKGAWLLFQVKHAPDWSCWRLFLFSPPFSFLFSFFFFTKQARKQETCLKVVQWYCI